MPLYDVFNGDADGICALQQWRLAHPAESVLITGVKRDIELVQRVTAKAGDEVAIFDIALEKNRSAVMQLLEAGARVIYFDHHYPGEIPQHENFTSIIDTSAEVCSSLLVNQYLNGRFSRWAVVGAFGDSLPRRAEQLAQSLDLSKAEIAQLQQLGECINYNGYGADLSDLHFPPQELCLMIRPYADPLTFIREEARVFAALVQGYESDLDQAMTLQPHLQEDALALYVLPDQPWARRVSGVFANLLAAQFPRRAHALLTEKSGGGYLVSVRAPEVDKQGADRLCLQFATGGGRKAAAGINHLPEDRLDDFVAALRQTFGRA
ncbi:MAG: DHH family phosphoesterase [Pseudomonadota bacterium]